jgi:hypothetical protein
MVLKNREEAEGSHATTQNHAVVRKQVWWYIHKSIQISEKWL